MTGSDTRVLILTPRFPLPLESGTQIREYHTLRALANEFDVTLVSLVQNDEGTERVDDVETFATVHTVSHSRSKPEALTRFVLSRRPYRVCKFTTKAFEQTTRDVLAGSSFDLIWANFLNSITAIPADAEPPIVLDEHNADVRYWRSFLNGGIGERFFARENIRRIERLRSNVCNRIDAVFSVSKEDAEEARSWIGDSPVWVMPNGVDIERFSRERSAGEVRDRVMFVGSLDVRMNEEAIVWFVQNAWEQVRRAHPEATFEIVGRNPTDSVTALGRVPGVEVVGEVESVVPYYDRATVVIAPFAFGGGTKLKVLEALAMERPLVTTPEGSTGLPIENERHACIRKRGPDFGDAVADLLADTDRRMQLAREGRALVVERFSWDAVTSNGVNQIQEYFFDGEP